MAEATTYRPAGSPGALDVSVKDLAAAPPGTHAAGHCALVPAHVG